MAYWYPRYGVDELGDIDKFNKEQGSGHMGNLEGMAKTCISECNAFCREIPTARVELNKPKLHRYSRFIHNLFPH